MSALSFISSRLRFNSRLALFSTAVSAFVTVIAVAVVSGFKRELRDSISSLYADITVYGDSGVAGSSQFFSQLSADLRVESVTPSMVVPSMLFREGEFDAVVFRSCEGFSDRLQVGIPHSLARSCGAQVGDTLLFYFLQGEKVRARNFTVAEIFGDPPMVDKKYTVVRASASDLQRVKGFVEDEYDCVEVRLKRGSRKLSVIRDMCWEIGSKTDYMCEASVDRFSAVYDWLQLLDANLLLILVLMVLVSGFNMVSAFLIVVMRGTPTIGMLKALGMSSRDISNVFLRLASGATVKGLIIGNVCALALCLVQVVTHVFTLNPESYFIGYVPIYINPLWLIVANVAIWAAVILFVSVPTRRISAIDSASTIQGEV